MQPPKKLQQLFFLRPKNYNKTATKILQPKKSPKKLQQKTNRSGFQHSVWVKKPYVRNEALDCWVYSYAAMVLYISKLKIYNREKLWKYLKQKLINKGNVQQRKNATMMDNSNNQNYVNSW